MDLEYLDDPGARVHTKKRKSVKHDESLDVVEDIDSDSIVQRWEWVFNRAWYVSHIYIMTAGMLNILLCLTRQVLKPYPRLFYRATFFITFITYWLSLLQNLNGATPGFYALLPLETFQYMCLALLWSVTIPHTIKLIPFTLFSLLHVADAASEHHAGSKRRAEIARELRDDLAPRVIRSLGYLDLWMILELLRDCLLIRPGAVVSLIVYLSFYRVKLLYSESALDAFMDVYHRLDHFLVRKSTPKRLKELWIRFRNKIGDTDDLRNSKLHKRETDAAIEKANLYGDIP